MMDYVYSLLMVYFLLCLYAFLTELPKKRSSWTFIFLFSITFPVLLITHLCSEWRTRRRRKKEECEDDF
jgi:hypothetical protein